MKLQKVAWMQKINCSVAKSLDQIGERWSLLIVREALMGSRRFDEFQSRLGIARNILTARLATLVETGVLARRATDNARIFDYVLTDKGRALLPVVAAIMHWGDAWIQGATGAPVVLVDRGSGKPVAHMNIRNAAGQVLSQADIQITAGPGATRVMHKRLGVM
jgi:DNA-binding HxlR family transcriptional regulator